MTSGSAEVFRDALRRSVPLIILCALLGVIVINGLEQLRGPRYAADAGVLVSTSQLGEILTGTQPSFVDPQRVQDTAQELASTPSIYEDAARGRAIGTPAQLRGATSVTTGTNSDVLTFHSSATTERRAVQTVNAVASAYTRFRSQLAQSSVAAAATQLQQSIDKLPAGSGERPALQRQLDRLHVLQSLPSSDALLVAPATSAGQTSPSPVRDSVLGLSLGLVIALLAIAVREAVDTKVRSDSAIEEVLSAPVIASIGTLPRGTRLIAPNRGNGAFTESYAMLAAQLSPDASPDGPTQMIAITSALPNEGKTTTSANVAVALARRGQRVLLADFDFRKASLGDVFGLPHDTHGALQVLDGSHSLDAMLREVDLDALLSSSSRNGRVPLQMEGTLLLLAAGGTVNPQDAPRPDQLLWLARALRDRADVIVIDTPAALLTVEMSEIARLVDAVVVVVRQGRITQRSLRSLGRQARGWEAEIAGAVVTDTPTEAGHYAYGPR
ncbi:MAG: tyrosine-protein kinase [Solirubrobacteraceae bacterium]|jgi:Mrp family chromosome partitioning ATPase|nr:tyrosine-protein kinase [Solirubrobacteraceae bacterium]